MADQSKQSTHTGVQIFSLAGALRQFCLKLESEAEQPIEHIEVNAGLFLRDLIAHLGFGKQQYDAILGEQTNEYLNTLVGEADNNGDG